MFCFICYFLLNFYNVFIITNFFQNEILKKICILCLISQGLTGLIGAQGAEGKQGPMVSEKFYFHLIKQFNKN